VASSPWPGLASGPVPVRSEGAFLWGVRPLRSLRLHLERFDSEVPGTSGGKEHARAVLARAKERVRLSNEAKQRAKQLTKLGFRPMDALHLALAEAGGAEYFCTCDDRLLRRAKNVLDLRVKVMSPVEFVQEIAK